jgi:hypothetical protein
MKKISIILMAFIGITIMSCKENAASKVNDENLEKAKEANARAKAGLPEMTFVSKEYDFGTINEGDEIDATFEFTNTGKSDLIITRAKASCGCTVPEWPRDKAIKPGEKSVIKAHFRSKGKRNNQRKSITLTTNTASGREVIYVKGFVTPDPNAPKKTPKNLSGKKLKPKINPNIKVK